MLLFHAGLYIWPRFDRFQRPLRVDAPSVGLIFDGDVKLPSYGQGGMWRAWVD